MSEQTPIVRYEVDSTSAYLVSPEGQTASVVFQDGSSFTPVLRSLSPEGAAHMARQFATIRRANELVLPADAILHRRGAPVVSDAELRARMQH